MLRFILFSIFIFLIIRLIARLILPFIMKEAFKKVKKEYEKNSSSPPKPPGTISVDYIPPTSPSHKNKKEGGEFIDYEEVK